MAGGYMGKYCIIDLTKQETKDVELGEDFYKKYLAGYGLGAAVLTELQKPGIDPLSPDAYLGMCSGLLSGTNSTFSGRAIMVGKSPLTGGWGDSNTGGFLAREIKRTGYDAIFFTGASEKPVWVHITDKGIEFKDASSLWGRDNIETNEAIKKELGEKKAQVASIGISGEKLSLISGITTDDGRIAARSGLGAVMGSKQLKAVSFRGNIDIPMANVDKMKELTKSVRKNIKASKGTDKLTVKIMGFVSKVIAKTGISIPTQQSLIKEIFRKYGTSGLTVYSGIVGDTPIKNWDGVGYTDFTYDSFLKISGDKVLENQKKKYACQSCPLGCGGIMNIKNGRYAGTEGHKPEYETWGSFGGMALNDDYDSIMDCNEMCNRAGIDSISAGCTVTFAIDCFENGVIDEKTTGGLKLGWGRSEEIVKLTEMMINREGFGDVLADGVKVAAEKIGNGAEKYAVHAGGQELPMHDPRLDKGQAISYQCEPTPGRHTISCDLYAHLFNVQKMFPGLKKELKKDTSKAQKDVRLHTAGSILMQIMNGCGICEFGPMSTLVPIFEYVNAAAGWDMTPEEYYTIGERLISMRKAFNVREGLTQEDSKLHDRAIGKVPLTSGPLKGVTVDIEGLQSDFYNLLGWDLKTGGPTAAKMKELEIDYLFA